MVFPIKGFGQFGGCGPEGRWPNQMCSFKLTADPAKPVVTASSGKTKVSKEQQCSVLACGLPTAIVSMDLSWYMQFLLKHVPHVYMAGFGVLLTWLLDLMSRHMLPCIPKTNPYSVPPCCFSDSLRCRSYSTFCCGIS